MVITVEQSTGTTLKVSTSNKAVLATGSWIRSGGEFTFFFYYQKENLMTESIRLLSKCMPHNCISGAVSTFKSLVIYINDNENVAEGKNRTDFVFNGQHGYENKVKK